MLQGWIVPTAESILSWATAVSNDWRWLAISWHVAFGALLIALVSGKRPSARLLAYALVLPVMSVSVVAWLSGNPFNGLVFAILSLLLLRAAVQLAPTAVTRGSSGSVLAGTGLMAFGLAYPHFVSTSTWTAYLYAAPFGLLPCPTLSLVIGATLFFRGLHAGRWSVPLVAAGVLYGVIGVFTLRVSLDVWLLAGAILLGGMVARDQRRAREIIQRSA